MGRFLTEKTIEDYLQDEIRVLPMPDGSQLALRAFRLTFANYDIVVKYGPLSAVEISALMLFYADKTGMELRYALREVLSPLRKVADRKLDQRIALRKQRLAMRKSLRSSFQSAAHGTCKPGERADPPERSTPLVFRAFLGQQIRDT